MSMTLPTASGCFIINYVCYCQDDTRKGSKSFSKTKDNKNARRGMNFSFHLEAKQKLQEKTDLSRFEEEEKNKV